MSDNKTIYLLAGEPSGDLYGAQLAHHLRTLLPAYELVGVAGPHMREAGVALHLPMEEFAVMGFTDVLLHLPSLVRNFFKIRDHILKSNPACVVFIDYPGLNLRLARSLRKKGYQGKLIHYICPSIWAWGEKRIGKMANSLDLLLTILPFENGYFTETRLPTKYVGHPLTPLTIGTPPAAVPKFLKKEKLIAIFPGSRMQEVYRNLPLQLAACELLMKKRADLSIAICCTNEEIQAIVREICSRHTFSSTPELVMAADRYQLMRESDAALAKSGTITLELALLQCPTVVSYTLTRLNRFIAKNIMKLQLPHYCIVNILGARKIFPELIQEPPTAEKLSSYLEMLLYDTEVKNRCLKGCQQICMMLSQEADPSLIAAEAITDELAKHQTHINERALT